MGEEYASIKTSMLRNDVIRSFATLHPLPSNFPIIQSERRHAAVTGCDTKMGSSMSCMLSFCGFAVVINTRRMPSDHSVHHSVVPTRSSKF